MFSKGQNPKTVFFLFRYYYNVIICSKIATFATVMRMHRILFVANYFAADVAILH